MALEAANRSVNGELSHRYTIARLHTSSPTAILNEHAVPKSWGNGHPASAIPAFRACAEAIKVGSPRALEYGNTLKLIARLSKGRTKYGYAEVWTDETDVVRVDPFLAERAASLVSPKPTALLSGAKWYRGAVHATFDGVLQYVDTRGALPEIKLTLSLGGQTLDCVCRADHVPIIGAAIEKRVRVTGTAIYDGLSGLPRRVEISHIEPISEAADFTRWKGAFSPFELDDWPED